MGASAHDDASRLLAVRPRTAHELRAGLRRRGHAAEAIEAALERLRAAGQLDDEALALHYVLTRGPRLGHGRARLLADLERRGVEPATARRAFERAVELGYVDPAAQLERAVERRVRSYPAGLDGRAYARVYNALLRAGFEAGPIVAALAAHRRGDGAGADDVEGAYGSDDESA